MLLTRGGYCVERGRLAISIETENADGDGWPPNALFCIHGIPLDRDPRVGDVFECHGGLMADDADDPDAAHAAAYFSFHAEEVFVRFEVVEARPGSLVFSFRAEHDDTDSYDERAERCPTSGTFVLPRRPLADLWIPA